MAKIKTKKEMNLPQLIEYGFKNNVTNTWYRASNVEEYISEVFFDVTGLPQFSSTVDRDDIFAVEIEEEITEVMEFHHTVERFVSRYENKYRYSTHHNKSIKDILNNRPPHVETTHIYAEVDNELMLIWKKGKLVE